MEQITSISKTSERCRLCMIDLSEVAEYYAIDETLCNLVLTLTGILVDVNDIRLSTSLCTECYSNLVDFNEKRNVWLTNQEKLFDDDPEDECEATGYQYELISDDAVGYDTEDNMKTEYFELEEIEDQIDQIAEVQLTSDEGSSRQDEEIRIPRRRPQSNRPEGRERGKGKDIYQKLLQKCTICFKSIEKNRMEGHMNKHNNIRPYACEVDGCEKMFYCKLLLRLHRTSMHTGLQIACNICKKTFPSDRSLYAHQLRHRNEDRYNCTFCEKKFNNSNSLKRHMAIHSGIREFTCDYCSSSFYRKFNLDVHIKTVHAKEKSFFCEHCPKKFGYARLLRAHISKNHLETVEEFVEEFMEQPIES